jgi:hypothetical protein
MLEYLYGKKVGFRLAQLIFETNIFPYKYPKNSQPVILHTYPPMKLGRTGCSEALAYKIQTPRNYPEESIKATTKFHQIPALATFVLHW